MYISHYPLNDISHSVQDFRQLLHSGEQNNVEGRFLPGLQQEVAAWCAPDKKIQFRRYNPAALHAFWQGYRQDTTYNLTRRNCSTTVILALDSALEGVLGDKPLWRRFLFLILDPNLWMLAVLRSRGETMTWTPGWCWTMPACYSRLPSDSTSAGGQNCAICGVSCVSARRQKRMRRNPAGKNFSLVPGDAKVVAHSPTPAGAHR
ncbi:Uncharacterised protein [Serratia plymuthica]|uniref:DUF4105 domain-containing protein n=1 Tax=Serratia plymuthica TaxID=82996 RepID=A0A2X4XEU9_SERPL|nr:Uncharacterised protein [Serratia plymuthica]